MDGALQKLACDKWLDKKKLNIFIARLNCYYVAAVASHCCTIEALFATVQQR